MSRILVMLPAYNESVHVADVVRRSRKHLPVLVVDDGSTDGTAAVAARAAAGVEVLSRPVKLGLGEAYRAGMRRALEMGADVIVTMDADGSHDPHRLPGLLAATADAGLVIGSRYVPGGGIGAWPLSRRLLSRMAQRVARRMLGPIAGDLTSGFRAYRRHVLETVPPAAVASNGYSFLIEYATLIHRAGFVVAEVPIVFEDRRAGRSKISEREILRAIGTLVRLRRDREPGSGRPV